MPWRQWTDPILINKLIFYECIINEYGRYCFVYLKWCLNLRPDPTDRLTGNQVWHRFMDVARENNKIWFEYLTHVAWGCSFLPFYGIFRSDVPHLLTEFRCLFMGNRMHSNYYWRLRGVLWRYWGMLPFFQGFAFNERKMLYILAFGIPCGVNSKNRSQEHIGIYILYASDVM